MSRDSMSPVCRILKKLYGLEFKNGLLNTHADLQKTIFFCAVRIYIEHFCAELCTKMAIKTYKICQIYCQIVREKKI